MEYGVRQLIPELGCAGTLRVVVDTSGVNIGAVLRSRGVFQKMGHVMDRMYPCRLQVGTPQAVVRAAVMYTVVKQQILGALRYWKVTAVHK